MGDTEQSAALAASRAASGPALAAGVVLAGPRPPAWQVAALAALAQKTSELKLLICPAAQPRPGGGAGVLGSLSRNLAGLLKRDDPRLPAALPPTSGRLRHYDPLSFDQGRPVFSESALENLDVVFLMPGAPLPLGLEDKARLGILSYHGDPEAAALAATIRGEDSAQTALVRTDPQGNRECVMSLSVAVDRLFPAVTARLLLSRAALFPARAAARFAALSRFAPESPLSLPKESPAPGLAGLAFFFLRGPFAAMRLVLQGAVSAEQWFLTLGAATDNLPASLAGTRPIYPPDGLGMADPFLFEEDGQTFLFFELIEQASGKGVIAATALSPDGRAAAPRIVLAKDYHLSYPFVFRYLDNIYMMPESAQAGRLDLYRATRFPYEWTHEKTLLDDIYLTDGTLFEYDGRFWLFGNVRENGGSSHDELHLFYAPSPLGPFTAHPENPVVADVRHARPAGRIFMLGDKIIRPAQDCSRHYGRAVEFRQILTLSPSGYREVFAGRLTPDGVGGNLKAHTYERLGGIWMADGLRRVLRRGGG